MAIKIYNPKRRSFNALNLSDSTDLPAVEVLLLNILIELQVLTQQMADANPVASSSDPEDIRSSIASEI